MVPFGVILLGLWATTGQPAHGTPLLSVAQEQSVQTQAARPIQSSESQAAICYYNGRPLLFIPRLHLIALDLDRGPNHRCSPAITGLSYVCNLGYYCCSGVLLANCIPILSVCCDAGSLLWGCPLGSSCGTFPGLATCNTLLGTSPVQAADHVGSLDGQIDKEHVVTVVAEATTDEFHSDAT